MGSIFSLQQIVNGLQLGAIYALIALGYTMVYGIVRLINFAHGDFFMVGAYASYAAFYMFNFFLPQGNAHGLRRAHRRHGRRRRLVALLSNQFAYKPLRYKPRLSSLVTAIGVSMLLEYLFSALPFIGPSPRGFPELLKKHMYLHRRCRDLQLRGDRPGRRRGPHDRPHLPGPAHPAGQGHARRVPGQGRRQAHGHRRGDGHRLHLRSSAARSPARPACWPA